jgi:hypothetical protein
MTADGERGYPDHVIDAAFGPDALAATHRRAEQPRWLAGLIAKHGQPVTFQPEPITLGASRFQTWAWAWVGCGVQVEQTLTTWTVSAHRRGRLAKLAGLKRYPTDAEISGVVALAGLDDAPDRGTS